MEHDSLEGEEIVLEGEGEDLLLGLPIPVPSVQELQQVQGYLSLELLLSV